jgi:apolipoprotein N-acyltransferase
VAAPAALSDLSAALPDARRGRETAVLVQPNISEDTQWTPESVDRMQRNLAALSLRAVMTGGSEHPALVVWPEVPAPLYYDADPRLRGYVADLARPPIPIFCWEWWRTRRKARRSTRPS